MLSFLKNLIDSNQATIGALRKAVLEVNDYENEFSSLSDKEIKQKSLQYLEDVRSSKTDIETIALEYFALVREVAKREMSMRPFDVQLMASLAFHQGKIAEQKTGEGKTLSAVPAVALNALAGQGVHVVTVNDYLARRDAGWMAPIYHALGLSVGVIFSGKGDLPAAIYDPEYSDESHEDDRLKTLRPVSRQVAYAADITYGTNNEFGFDYLRDNMVQQKGELVQRGHHFAIVDEVDSILIDEARTPLIISSPDSEPTDKYYTFAGLIGSLSADTDYEVDEKLRTATLTDHGLRKLEKILKVDNIYEKDFDTVHHIEQALKARTLFLKDRDYVVKDDQIIIVDEHTGRLMYGRRYSEGLHQAIEAKENVKIQQESRTLATISLQNYFRMYKKLSGMTGTAETEAEEFRKIYKLDVVVVPTNREIKRADFADVVYKTTRAKYAAIVSDIYEANQKGQPVLVGTKSIDQNEVVSQFLRKKKIPHQVLNAKNHENEAQIIAEAGNPGAVTVATNIAGRGVDIVLGGSKDGKTEKEWQEKHDQVIAAGGLHVVGAVRHESRRIDDQLRGRSGRQGDPGSSRFYVSLEDDIMRIFGGEQVSRLMDFLKVPEDQPLEAGMVSKAIETAQKKVESFNFDMRKNVVEYDDVVNKQREIIYKLRRSILDESESEPQKISERILSILKEETDIMIQQISVDGITDDEVAALLQNFYLMVPLDEQSQKTLKEYVLADRDPEHLKSHFHTMIEDIYKSKGDSLGQDMMYALERMVYLSSIDQLWMDHLDTLDDLRDGIRLRGYAQKDPLVEYKKEAFGLFGDLIDRINLRVAQQIIRLSPIRQQERRVVTNQPGTDLKQQNKKIGRNDPCWCGSGKKWKKCHYPKES
jgi:preprotein translocase subunit SecA